MDKKKFSTFSYKLVQISPIMILVNSGAFLSISSWFCELTELIFVMIPYISSTGYPPTTQGIMGHVQVANWRVLSWLNHQPLENEPENTAEIEARITLCVLSQRKVVVEGGGVGREASTRNREQSR